MPEPDRQRPGELPSAVRHRLVAAAGATLLAMPDAGVPASLARLRSFAPARLAKAGAVPLAAALAGDSGFRTRVAGDWSASHRELADAVRDGSAPEDADPEDVAVAAYLLRPEGWEDLQATALGALRADRDRERHDARVERARAEAERARQAVDELRRAGAEDRERLRAQDEELHELRRALRRAKADADRAAARAREAEAGATRARADLEASRAAAAQRLDRARAEIEALTAELDAARAVHRRGHTLHDVRTRLLLDTVVDAAGALRRHLELPAIGLKPADTVLGDEVPVDEDWRSLVRGRDTADPTILGELLTVPQVHLIVDGYNVTKTGFGHMTLADQRTRLVDGLSGIASRTGAEITCCFDGRELGGRIPGSHARGVRVQFSVGEIADELIRRLVRAEPAGRPVVVVSSDQEVMASVAGMGAWPVPSQALLRLLGWL